MVIEKKHHLPQDAYRGLTAIAFTMCVQNRNPVFQDGNLFNACRDILVETAANQNAEILIYLFMPDHLHFVAKGKNKDSDLAELIVKFKQKSGFRLAGQGLKWQKNYYDHILRTEEEIVKHIRYILENPVRKGLILDWNDYLFKGSTCYDLKTLF